MRSDSNKMIYNSKIRYNSKSVRHSLIFLPVLAILVALFVLLYPKKVHAETFRDTCFVAQVDTFVSGLKITDPSSRF